MCSQKHKLHILSKITFCACLAINTLKQITSTAYGEQYEKSTTFWRGTLCPTSVQGRGTD